MFKGNRDRDRDERPTFAPPPPPPPPQPSASSGAKRGMFSVIGPDIVITGNVAATADLHIDGRVDGDIQCGNLAAGIESRIFGNVAAEVARLAGSIEGTVRAKQLTIEHSARISGDVEYENISIENGGYIDGRLKHMSKLDLSPKPAPTPNVLTPAPAPQAPAPQAQAQAAPTMIPAPEPRPNASGQAG